MDGKINELNNSRMVSMFGMVLLLCALGMPIYCILDNIPMIEMPKFIGCLFAGAIARNVMEALNIKFYTPEVDAIEHMFLELYLALVLMTIDITALADVLADGHHPAASGSAHGSVRHLCLLQHVRPQLRRRRHGRRQLRLGLRLWSQCRCQ